MDERTSELKKVSILGGAPVAICDVPTGQIRGATWGPDGTIVFATLGEGGLWRVPADGGEPEVLKVPDPDRGETGYFWPAFLPGGRALVYTIYTGSPSRQLSNRGVSLSAEDVELAVLELDTNENTRLVPGSSPHYSPTGHLVYGMETRHWAVRFDGDRLSTIGAPIPVLDGVATKSGGGVDFSLSNNGLLAYVPLKGRVDRRRSLVWVDREGREEVLAAEPRTYLKPRISPDGSRVAVSVDDSGNWDVWIYDLARETSSRVTFDPATDSRQVWTRDGQRVVFSSARGRVGVLGNLFWKAADGTGSVERLTTSDYSQIPQSWSLDGRTLVFEQQNDNLGVLGGSDLYLLSMDGERIANPLFQTEFREVRPAISPNGRWIVYRSNESGRPEIYVRPFPNVEDGKWMISPDGGNSPVWGPQGREIFYRSLEDGAMMAAKIRTEPTFTAEAPVVLFTGNYYRGIDRNYDISPDGQRFLMLKEVGQSADPDTLVVVLNWFEELKRLVPTE